MSYTQRDELEKQGFAIVPKVVSEETLGQISDEISELASQRSRAGIRHAMHMAPVTKTASCPERMAMVCDVLGPQAFPFRATIFDKSQDANWLVAWHQDTALPLRHQLDVLGWGPWSKKEGIPYAHAPA